MVVVGIGVFAGRLYLDVYNNQWLYEFGLDRVARYGSVPVALICVGEGVWLIAEVWRAEKRAETRGRAENRGRESF